MIRIAVYLLPLALSLANIPPLDGIPNIGYLATYALFLPMVLTALRSHRQLQLLLVAGILTLYFVRTQVFSKAGFKDFAMLTAFFYLYSCFGDPSPRVRRWLQVYALGWLTVGALSGLAFLITFDTPLAAKLMGYIRYNELTVIRGQLTDEIIQASAKRFFFGNAIEGPVMVALSLGILMRNRIGSPLFRLLLFAVNVLAIAVSQSRAAVAVVVLTVTFECLSRLRRDRNRIRLIGEFTALGVLLAAIGIMLAADKAVVFRQRFQPTTWFSQGSGIQRVELVQAGLQMFMADPVFGCGYGTFLRDSHKILGYNQTIENSYAQALTEGGSVGLVLFLGWATFPLLARYRRQRSRLQLAYGIFVTTLVFMVLPFEPANPLLTMALGTALATFATPLAPVRQPVTRASVEMPLPARRAT